jgi:hypothetical protein
MSRQSRHERGCFDSQQQQNHWYVILEATISDVQRLLDSIRRHRGRFRGNIHSLQASYQLQVLLLRDTTIDPPELGLRDSTRGTLRRTKHRYSVAYPVFERHAWIQTTMVHLWVPTLLRPSTGRTAVRTSTVNYLWPGCFKRCNTVRETSTVSPSSPVNTALVLWLAIEN